MKKTKTTQNNELILLKNIVRLPKACYTVDYFSVMKYNQYIKYLFYVCLSWINDP